MQSQTPTNSSDDSNKKFNLLLLLKENWKFVSIISTIICGITLWVYLKHFNRLDLFIELVKDNKIDLIFIIFSFIPICFSLLFILNLSGWISVIYLDLLDFQHNEYSHKWSLIFIPIFASALPIILFLCKDYLLKIDDNSVNFLGCVFLTILFCFIFFYFKVKSNKNVKFVNKIVCFACLFFLPFTMFHITGMFLIFRFVTGELTCLSFILISLIIFVFAVISQTPLFFYFRNIEKNELLDKNDLFNNIIIKSIFVSIVVLVLVFILLNKVFVFSSYAALRLFGVVDLNSVYEFSLVKNDVTVMKLAENEWKFDYEFHDQISLKGSIGFHLGDIYLICKEGANEMFMESLRYDLAKQEIKPIDNKACIFFKNDEVNIIQIKAQNNNGQSTEE